MRINVKYGEYDGSKLDLSLGRAEIGWSFALRSFIPIFKWYQFAHDRCYCRPNAFGYLIPAFLIDPWDLGEIFRKIVPALMLNWRGSLKVSPELQTRLV